MTIKKKVVWRIVVLATAFSLLGGGAGGFYVYRKARIRAQYMRLRADGMAAAGHGDAQRAVDLLGTYLQQRDPDDPEVLSRFVIAQSACIRSLAGPDKRSDRLDRIRSNIYALRHLLKLPRRTEVQQTADRRQLLDLYMQVGLWSEALDTADTLPQDVPVLAARAKALAGPWQAQGLIGLKRFPEAVAPAIQWSRLAPTDIDAQFELLFVLQRTQKFDAFWEKYKAQPTTQDSAASDEPVVKVADVLAQAASRELARLRPSQPADDPRPEMIRARALALAGRNREAGDLLISAAGRTLSDRDVAAALMNSLNEVGRGDQSLAVLKRLQQGQSDDPTLRAELARREWQLGDAKSAADLLSKLDPVDPSSDSELLGLRSLALTQLGRRDDAEAIRRALSSRQKDATAAAWAAVLDPATPQQTGNVERVVQLCQTALQGRQSAYLSYYLGEAYVMRGDMGSAIKAWNVAATSNATWAVPAVRLADAFADAGRYEYARQAAQEAFRRDPRTAITLARVSDLSVQSGRVRANDLLPWVNQLASQVKGKDQGELLCVQVDLLALNGTSQDAILEANKTLDNHELPLSQRSLLRLASISRQRRLGLEDKCLARCEVDHGITPDLAFAKALDLYLAKRGDEGLKVLEADRAKAASPQSIAWRTVRARYLDLVQDPGAKKAVADLADGNPDNLRLQQMALDARSTRGDAELLQRLIDRVHSLAGEQGLTWPLARARWLLQFAKGNEQILEALKLLGDVTRQAPDLLEGHLLMGRACERAGRVPEAIEQFRIATMLSPNSVALGYELARLLELRGDFDAAHGELARISSLPTADPDAREKAAVLAYQSGDPQLALSLSQEAAGQAVRQGSGDLLVAQMLWLAGKTDEAEALCRKLLEKPDLPIIVFAAKVYATQGRLDDANRVLVGLDQLKLEPGVKQLALADFASRFETPAATLSHLQEATTLAPGNPTVWRTLISFHLGNGRPVDALAALAEALRVVPADSASALRALQNHADLFAVASDPDLRPLVGVLVNNPAESAGSTTAAQALQAIVNARAAKQSPAQLALTLRELADGRPPLLPLQIYLAIAYERANQPDEAMATANRAAQQFPSAAEPQVTLVALLQDQQRWAEVLPAARKWRQLAAGDPVSADLAIAQACLKLNRADEALRQLDPYVKNAQSNPRAYERVLAAYAAAQQAAGRSGVAELMQPLLQQGPRGRATWIMFAVANLPPAEAAGWLDRAEQVIPADKIDEQLLLARMWSRLAESGHDPTSLQKARAIVKPLIDKPDAAPGTVLLMGMINEQAGKLQDAQGDYRRVLKLTPDDITARNNLAMILAKSGGDLNEAVGLVQYAIQRSDATVAPFLPSLYDTLAFIQGKLKRYADAESSAQTAIKLGPQAVQYRVTLAQVQLDGGKSEAAAKTMRDVDDLLRQLEGRQQGLGAQPQSLRQQIEALRVALKGAAGQAAAK